MGIGKQKGGSFERSIAVELSLWWTQGKDDSTFWRSQSSGARATTRGLKNKQTSGQYGDICATCPIGEPLTRLITIEVKRGYAKACIWDLLDKPKSAKEQVYEKWIKKAIFDSKAAQSCYWIIIHKRDRREAIVTSPCGMLLDLEEYKNKGEEIYPICNTTIKIDGEVLNVQSYLLSDFFKIASPKRIKKVVEQYSVGREEEE